MDWDRPREKKEWKFVIICVKCWKKNREYGEKILDLEGKQ